MSSQQILDELEAWLREWERALITSLNGTQPYDSIDSACEYHTRKQMIYCLRMTQDRLKELREKTEEKNADPYGLNNLSVRKTWGGV